MALEKNEDNTNNNANDTKNDTNKPASAGWSRLKSSAAKATSESNKPATPAPPTAENKPDSASSKPKSAGWSRLKGATNKSNETKSEETQPLTKATTGEKEKAPVTGSGSGLSKLDAKRKWSKTKDLLGSSANGSVKPILVRTDSLVVPGQTHRPSISFSDGRDSPRSQSEKSLGSRRGSSRSIESRFSAIDISKLQATQAPVAEEEEDDKNKATQTETYLQLAIPYLPMWLASLCLVMNILIPGTGTILSGLSIFCCGKARVESKSEDKNTTVFCTNFFVGCAQLFTVTFMLVGWFWSLTWGIYMVILATEMKREEKKKHEAKLQAMALTAFNPQVRPWTLTQRSN